MCSVMAIGGGQRADDTEDSLLGATDAAGSQTLRGPWPFGRTTPPNDTPRIHKQAYLGSLMTRMTFAPQRMTRWSLCRDWILVRRSWVGRISRWLFLAVQLGNCRVRIRFPAASGADRAIEAFGRDEPKGHRHRQSLHLGWRVSPTCPRGLADHPKVRRRWPLN